MIKNLNAYENIDIIDDCDNRYTFTATAVEVFPDNLEEFRIHTVECITIFVVVRSKFAEDIYKMAPEDVLHMAWRDWFIEND